MHGIKRLLAAGIVGAALAVSMAGGAFAFHPGHNDNPTHEMPQGPNLIACENQGGDQNPNDMGVFNAIDHGGEVHCQEGE